jgi:DAACS family dicarboxylate/amino acid:cation (Na+ or H+) symporter
MNDSAPNPDRDEASDLRAIFKWYRSVPLYLRILVAMGLGLALGLLLGHRTEPLVWVSRVILRFLGALAPALILVAVIDAIMNADIKGRGAARMVWLLAINTLVAIVIGLIVANVVRPGKDAKVATAATTSPTTNATTLPAAALPEPPAGQKVPKTEDVGQQIFEQLPKSVIEPLASNNVIGVVILAVAFGIAFRRLAKTTDVSSVRQSVALALKAVVMILHWVLEVVPLAVLCTVAETVGTKGFGPFVKLGWFIVAVLIALALQATWYLTRIALGSWVRPAHLLKGIRDALVMAFSTSSSTATMPVTYACLRERVGLREDSASMGALVGSNFNNDGTALYEAMAALFIAQMLHIDLTLADQAIVVVMAVIASVGAAGIPEAGLVTMTLVFKAVHLPPEYIFLLLPVDWFLDRCRTMINVMGDVSVACLLEGKERAPTTETPTVAEAVA